MTNREVFPWEDMDHDVLECGDPDATHALYVKALRARAEQSRKISREQGQAAVDCLNGQKEFATYALKFDALADALEGVSFQVTA